MYITMSTLFTLNFPHSQKLVMMRGQQKKDGEHCCSTPSENTLSGLILCHSQVISNCPHFPSVLCCTTDPRKRFQDVRRCAILATICVCRGRRLEPSKRLYHAWRPSRGRCRTWRPQHNEEARYHIRYRAVEDCRITRYARVGHGTSYVATVHILSSEFHDRTVPSGSSIVPWVFTHRDSNDQFPQPPPELISKSSVPTGHVSQSGCPARAMTFCAFSLKSCLSIFLSFLCTFD